MASVAPSDRLGEPLRLRFDAFELDEADARLTREGRAIALAPKAFAVLCALVRQPASLMTKNALLDAVWGHQFVSESVLKTTISELRAALADDAKQPRYIETVARRGYRFVGSVGPTAARATPDLALPARTQSTPSLIGRQAELSRLRAAWDRAAVGQRQIFWIAGEAGVGKTTLIDHFIASLGPVAFTRGQCVEQYGAGEPYLPVLEALAELCRHDGSLPSLLRSTAPTWLLQMPWLAGDSERDSLRREVAGATQDRMLRELGELLDRYTQDRPLLLVTEDLHWSDQATVHLMNHVARRRSPARLMWIASFRLAEVIAEDHSLKALRHELRLHRLCEEIVLDSFSEQEIADYLARRVPGFDASEPLVRALHARTEGLPLFLSNVVDDLLARGTDRPAAELRADSLAVPENLAGIIEKQIGRLAPESRTVLEAASVCGVEFRATTVAAALERDPDSTAHCCDELARRQQWLNAAAVERLADGSLDARFAFRHALYRHVFYERIGAARRADLHHRIGRALAKSDGAPAELAMHFERGHDPRTAVQYYAAAAGNAMGHFAPLEATQLARRGLELLAHCPDDPAKLARAFSLLTTRGVAATQLHGVASPEAVESIDRARELSERMPPSVETTLAQTGLGWIYYARGDFDAALALAQRIWQHGKESGDPVLQLCGCNLMGVTVCNRGNLNESRRWLDEGIALAIAHGRALASGRFVIDPETSMRANISQPLANLGLTDAARAQAAAALARAQASGQPMATMLAHWCACILEIRCGTVERVRPHAQALAECVDRYSIAQGEGPSRWYRGWVLAHDGDPLAGQRLILEGYGRHARFGMYCGCARVLGYAAEALEAAGDFDGALRQLDEALALAQRIAETLDVPELLLLRARILLSLKQLDAARQSLRDALLRAQAIDATRFVVAALTALSRLPKAEKRDVRALRAALAELPADFDEGLRADARATLSDPNR